MGIRRGDGLSNAHATYAVLNKRSTDVNGKAKDVEQRLIVVEDSTDG